MTQGIALHAHVSNSANGRGMFMAQCRCGHRAYASSKQMAQDKLAVHVRNREATR